MKIDKTTTAYVYVRVTCVGTEALACDYSVQLNRPANILGEKDEIVESCPVTVWEAGGILIGPRTNMASRLRDQIAVKLTKLAAEYYRQNP